MNIPDVVERSDDDAQFARFVDDVSPNLLRALVAAFGPQVGREAAVDALAWGWEHWARLRRMSNPAGYLYRVGQTNARRALRYAERVEVVSAVEPADAHHDVEPDVVLQRALDALSPRQRSAALLVVGYGMSQPEAARVIGCSVSSLRNHLDRALRNLRRRMEDRNDES